MLGGRSTCAYSLLCASPSPYFKFYLNQIPTNLNRPLLTPPHGLYKPPPFFNHSRKSVPVSHRTASHSSPVFSMIYKLRIGKQGGGGQGGGPGGPPMVN